ncbi:MAG TPA: hypothetical protein VMJ73_08275 [Rhizomicrobium sp.]|jgi:hypothetical protein|nr:hypothetical protein [Rhizomicrobium sp.]
MTKIGVGIGEDFPADDTKPAEAPRGDDGRNRDEAYNDAEYAARREAYRKWREQRREWKRQWRNEWRARKRAFREQVHKSLSENGVPHGRYHDDHAHREFWNHTILWAVLGVIAAIAIVSFIFSHIFVVVGVVALLALFAAYHRGHDPFAMEPYDYPHTTTPPSAPRDAAQ